MRKFSCLAGFLFLVLFSPSSLKAQTLGQIFGGYSYIRTDVPVLTIAGVSSLCAPPTCPVPTGSTSIQTNGWEVAGAIKTFPFMRLAADFSGHYGSFGGAKISMRTYMFGPEFAIPLRISPFIHVLAGRAHKNEAGYAQAVLATSFGGGVDVKAAPFIKIRLFQLDYFRTTFDGQVQHRPRISAGLILSF
ncbi:MAG: hypothetical protein LAN71_06310 [Acidobacteriia bacterium]|nr:hypothetical protein [Terriglobia bacterium]